MATSFKKRSAGRPQHPRGSRPSLHNAQLLVSSGVPSMDALLGGGLAVGTVLLIEEDLLESYSHVLLKMFLSEGVLCGHSLFLASAREDPAEMIKDLPSAVGEEGGISHSGTVPLGKPTAPGQAAETQLEIAWRYQNLPQVQSSFSNRFGHFFDLTSAMDPSRLAAVDTTTLDVSQIEARNCGDLYTILKSRIQSKIQNGHFSVDSQPSVLQRNVLRIALHSLGSPLWLDEPSLSPSSSPFPSSSSSPTLLQFLHTLRAILRRAYAVAVITIPTHLMQDEVYVSRLERLCDSVVRIESFTGSDKEKNPLYQDYHGLFHVVKLPRLNSLTSHLPETLDLAFKLRRKKFSIEKLHLPPELSDTASRSQEEHSLAKPTGGPILRVGEQKSTGKTSVSKHNIDF